jgi:hypothetical protein
LCSRRFVGPRQRLVQQPPGRADESLAPQVLVVAGLLAYQHQGRMGRALARHRLRGVVPEVAAAAGVQVRRVGYRDVSLRRHVVPAVGGGVSSG